MNPLAFYNFVYLSTYIHFLFECLSYKVDAMSQPSEGDHVFNQQRRPATMCCIVDVFKAGGDCKLAVTANGVAVEPHTVAELSP